MALLSSKKKPAKKVTAEPVAKGRYRVCVAKFVSQHETHSEASRELLRLALKGDDIAFILEVKR